MRPVKRDLTDKPAILINATTLENLDTVINEANPSLIRAIFYQGPYIDAEGKRQMSVRDKLNESYLHKCAYCETDCKAEIEHYRPKKGVSDDLTHPGYYWLCYEWSNLIPSCHDCNTAGGKGNQFPVQGKRVTSPPKDPAAKLINSHMLPNASPLSEEQPYLLHPEYDYPLDFLAVRPDPNGDGICLYGVDSPNGRGEQTIRICNLNRKNLKINRLNTLNDFIEGINLVFGLLIDKILKVADLEKALCVVFKQMDRNVHEIRFQHTLVRRYAVANDAQFASLVLSLLEHTQRDIVMAAFSEYRQSNPLSTL